ncbi:uncharacterized protein METZ01_LOCUS26817, partial [marine metagenome]
VAPASWKARAWAAGLLPYTVSCS